MKKCLKIGQICEQRLKSMPSESLPGDGSLLFLKVYAFYSLASSTRTYEDLNVS